MRITAESPWLVSDADRRFTGMPVHTIYVDGRQWELRRNVSYRIHDGFFAGAVTTVREGFVFDWASIPRLFWMILPPAGLTGNPYGIAALFHDWICRHKKIGGQPCTRYDADRVFLEIMLYIGVHPIIAQTMYRAVRMAGWMPWWNFGGNDTQGGNIQ